MTNRRPYMPLYIDDYEADTKHLTVAEDGCYSRLLRAMWRAGGSLPADEKSLCQIARITTHHWRKMATTILAFFIVVDGHLEQKRLKAEMRRVKTVSEARATAGREGGKATQGKTVAQIRNEFDDSSTSKPLKNGDAGEAIASARASAPPAGGRPSFGRETPDSRGDAIASLFPDLPVGTSGLSAKEAEAEFAKWYGRYPLKTGKGQARVAFQRARRKASLQELLDGVERYRGNKLPDRSWRYPATWLNGEGWLDEPEPVPASRSPPNSAVALAASQADDYSDENLLRIAREYEAKHARK